MRVGRRAGGAVFRAPFDAIVLLITVAVTGILVVGIVGSSLVAITDHSLPAGLLALLFAAGIMLAVLYAPTGYRVEPGVVTVERAVAPVRISLDGLQCATLGRPPKRVTLVGYRNGGMFSVCGRLWTSADGWMYFWGRRVSNCVLLQFDHRLVVLMPDDPDRFVAAIAEARVLEPT